MKLGTQEISEIRLGSKLISAAYLGARPLAGGGGLKFSKLAILGDSITDRFSLQQSGGSFRFAAGNTFSVFQPMLKQRVQMVTRPNGQGISAGPDYDFGYSGFGTGQILNGYEALLPMTHVLATDAEAVFVMIGVNDLPGGNMGTIKSNIAAILGQIKAAGKIAILATLLPVGAEASTARRDEVAALNADLPAIAAATGSLFCPWHTVIPLDGDGYAVAEYIAPDGTGVHPSPLGGFVLGKYLAQWLDPMVVKEPQFTIPPVSDASWVTPNPYFSGGATQATGWQPQTTASRTYTYAKNTDADGIVWQRVSEMTASTGGRDIYNRLTTGSSALSGRTVRACCRFRGLPTDWGALSTYLSLQCFGATNPYSSVLETTSAQRGYHTTPIDPWEGTMVTAPIVVPDSATQIWCQIWVYGPGTWEVAQAGVFTVD